MTTSSPCFASTPFRRKGVMSVRHRLFVLPLRNEGRSESERAHSATTDALCFFRSSNKEVNLDD